MNRTMNFKCDCHINLCALRTYIPRNLMIFLLEVVWKYPDAPAAFYCVFSLFHAFGHLTGFYAGSHSLIPCPGGTERVGVGVVVGREERDRV